MMLPKFNIRLVRGVGSGRSVYAAMYPAPKVVHSDEAPWIPDYRGMPGTSEEQPRRIEHATIYRLVDQYGRQTIGIAPETRELRNALFEIGGRSKPEMWPQYNYIAAGFAGTAVFDLRGALAALVVYQCGFVDAWMASILAKRRISTMLNDPECAEFLRHI